MAEHGKLQNSTFGAPEQLASAKGLGITSTMLEDPPLVGDRRYKMYSSHGPNWCAWQEVWLDGLESLPSGSKVYVLTSSTGHLGAAQYSFKGKFMDTGRWDDEGECTACSFDPRYRLEGYSARAQSILDWERLHIERVAEEHGLVITQLWHRSSGGQGAAWYPTAFAAVVELSSSSSYSSDVSLPTRY
jgi:hypothetical protein